MNEEIYVNGLYWSVKLDLALLYYYFPDITPSEAILLYYLRDFCYSKSSKIKKIIKNGKEYKWITYMQIIKQVPILHINTREGIRKLLKKLFNRGLFDYIVEKGKIFICPTEKLDTIIFPNVSIEKRGVVNRGKQPEGVSTPVDGDVNSSSGGVNPSRRRCQLQLTEVSTTVDAYYTNNYIQNKYIHNNNIQEDFLKNNNFENKKIEQKTNDSAQTNYTAQNNPTPSIQVNKKIKICKYCKLEILNEEDLFELNVDSFSHKKCYENYLKSKIEEKNLNNQDNSIDSYFERLKNKYEGSKKTKYDYENIISEEEEQKLEDEISVLERKIKNKKASPDGEEFKVWDLEAY